MAIAQLWLFAGPNGAGKTTFTKRPAFSEHIGHFLKSSYFTITFRTRRLSPSLGAGLGPGVAFGVKLSSLTSTAVDMSFLVLL